MLEFEGIRIITLGVKDSIDLGRVNDSINLVELRSPLKYGRVKEFINWIESRTSLQYGRVKDSIKIW